MYTSNLSQTYLMSAYYEEIGCLTQESASKFQDLLETLANVLVF